jgi:hypothetical protein
MISPSNVSNEISESKVFILKSLSNNKFTLTWGAHQLRGKGSYLQPWKRITKFANEIAGTIAKRFPPEEFLKSLDVFVPEEWRKAHDPSFSTSNHHLLCSV